MSADLDALDRGVVDAGLIAAEALARVDDLEREVAFLRQRNEALEDDLAEVASLKRALVLAFEAAGIEYPSALRERPLRVAGGERR